VIACHFGKRITQGQPQLVLYLLTHDGVSSLLRVAALAGFDGHDLTLPRATSAPEL
jgi:hypothetical protein